MNMKTHSANLSLIEWTRAGTSDSHGTHSHLTDGIRCGDAVFEEHAVADNLSISKLTIMLLFSSLLLTSASGCSRFRNFTRRDYAAMQDPFVDPSAVGDVNSNAGIATLDDTTSRATVASEIGTQTRPQPSAQNAVAASNPPTATNRESSTAPVNSMTASSTTGPSLSDFVGKTAPAEVPSDASADSVKDQDMAGFAQFLEQQAAASGLTDTARELDKDFAAFTAQAEDEKDLLIQKTRQAANRSHEVAQPLIRKVSEIRTAAMVGEPSTEKAFGENPFDESASPLVQHALSTIAEPVKSPAASRQSKPAEFEQKTDVAEETERNPFAEFESLPAATSLPPSVAPKQEPVKNHNSPAKPLDATFKFDTGWKPSTLVRP